MDELIKSLPCWLQLSLLFGPTIGVFIAAIGVFIAASALRLNRCQTELSNKLSRARLVYDSLHTFLKDDIMQSAFYKIEYEKFEYRPENFHDSKEEREIDRLLRHFSNLAILWRDELLDLKDVSPLHYHISRITTDPEIIKYLSYLKERWRPRMGIEDHPYNELQSLAKALEQPEVGQV